MTDNEIITLSFRVTSDKFRVIVDKYQQMVFRTCMGFLHNREDAEELTQDVFIQTYQSLSRFKGESAFSTW
jgi:RNA polymerase sigma-70 factor (ECF subfamily)